MDIECTDDLIKNEKTLTLFKLGMSLRFCMTTATGQGVDGMRTLVLPPRVLSTLCEKVGFWHINNIAINHPLNSLFEIKV